MKESWLEKLIELLNEYWRQHEWVYRIDFQTDMDFTKREETLFCSKYWWRIQRLVENDKIDFDNRDLKDRFMNEFERYPQFQNNTTNREFNINGLLMLLSISDTPIDDLLLYLK